MILEYNILSEDKKIKGLIGEIIAAKCLKKKGFIVSRPSKILRFLKEVNAPDNYEVQFLRRYQKTMDFFAVLPGPEPFLGWRQVVYGLFSNGGLNKYLNSADPGHRGFVVEVKSRSKGSSNGLSKRQKSMFRHAKKVGFDVIFPSVTFKEGYTVEVKFEDFFKKQDMESIEK